MTKEEFVSALNTLGDNQTLLDALESSKDLAEIVRLLNAEGVAVTAEELAEFTADEGESELDENELDAVAGGSLVSWWELICRQLEYEWKKYRDQVKKGVTNR